MDAARAVFRGDSAFATIVGGKRHWEAALSYDASGGGDVRNRSTHGSQSP